VVKHSVAPGVTGTLIPALANVIRQVMMQQRVVLGIGGVINQSLKVQEVKIMKKIIVLLSLTLVLATATGLWAQRGFSVFGYQIIQNETRTIPPGNYWQAQFQMYEPAGVRVTLSTEGAICPWSVVESWMKNPDISGPNGCLAFGSVMQLNVDAGMYSVLVRNSGDSGKVVSMKIELSRLR